MRCTEIAGRCVLTFDRSPRRVGVEIGKYAAAYHSRLRNVKLDDDVAGRFADHESVNAALREYLTNHEKVGR